MVTNPYLSIGEVSAELGISKSGVYKLIQRGRLRAIKRSERGTLIPRLALEAYRRRLGSGAAPTPAVAEETGDIEALASAFSDETGNSPAEWVEAWKADLLEDSAENMRRTIRALAILAARREGPDRGMAGVGAPASAVRR
jgi:excisionase family DNA binding protein